MIGRLSNPRMICARERRICRTAPPPIARLQCADQVAMIAKRLRQVPLLVLQPAQRHEADAIIGVEQALHGIG